MQPWSPLPEHIRAIPAKNYQRKSLFQLILKGEPKRLEPINFEKVSTTKHKKMGFGLSKNQQITSVQTSEKHEKIKKALLY